MRTGSRRGPFARLVLIVSAIGLFLIGYYWGNQYKYSGGPPAIEGVMISPAMPLAEFDLRDAQGRPFGSEDLADRWTLLAFGEISQARGQLAVTHMIEVYNRLADRPELRDRLQLLLAAPSQSPNLASDFQRLSPALRILSGEESELSRLAGLLGASPTGIGEEGAARYLIAPNGSLLALFAAGQPAEAVASDVMTLSDWPLEALTALPDE
jgi:hypothetical protein